MSFPTAGERLFVSNPEKSLKRFTRLLTLPLTRVSSPPVRVEAKAGKGFHILLHSSGGGLLHVALTGARDTPVAFVRTRTTSMRYMGDRSPTGEEEVWLETLTASLQEVEQQPGWSVFLAWAMREPATALPPGVPSAERFSSGEAALIRINTRCNAHCDFCSARGLLPDLVEDPEQIRECVKALARARQNMVSFTGGEPTLRKDLPSLLSFAREHGIANIDVQTNGLLLARPEMVKRLSAAGMSSIFLSLHSASEEVHDAMLKVPGAFRKALRTVAHCLEAGVEVRYNYVVNNMNLDGVADFVEFIARRFGRPGTHICLSFIALQGWALDHPELIPRLDAAAPRMAAGLDAGSRLGLDVRIPGLCGIPMCMLPGREKQFDEFHDTNPPPQSALRSFPPACGRCPFRLRCSGFWTAYIDRFGDGEFGYRGP